MEIFLSLLLLTQVYSNAAQSECPEPACTNPCEAPGFRGRDKDGCPSCECICPILEDCGVIECASGQVPFTQDESVGGCARCLCVAADDKPGICPDIPTSSGGPCAVDCTIDSDCAGNQKCCGRCPRRCVSSAAPRAQDKPGRCPSIDINVIDNCTAKCDVDNDCPGAQKCCGDCGRCTAPATSRSPWRQDAPGRCPQRFQRVRSNCGSRRSRKSCDTDADCRNGKICCGSCIRRCVQGKVRRKSVSMF